MQSGEASLTQAGYAGLSEIQGSTKKLLAERGTVLTLPGKYEAIGILIYSQCCRCHESTTSYHLMQLLASCIFIKKY